MNIIYPIYLSLPSPLARSIQIVNTCQALAQGGAQVDLLCAKSVNKADIIKSYGLSDLTDTFNIKGLAALIKTPESKLRFSARAPWDWGVQRFIRKALTQAKCNNQAKPIIYLRELKTAKALLPLLKKYDLPAVYEAHHIEFRIAENNGKAPSEVAAIRKIETEIYQTVTQMIAITDAVGVALKDDFISIATPLVLPNGCTPPPTPKTVSTEYLFYAGQLYEWKGVDTIIEMMKYLPAEHLVIAGGAHIKDLERCKAIACEYGVQNQITFLGQLPHAAIPAHAWRAKALLLPNKDQLYNQAYTSPIKLFEYLNYGKPIIASDLPTVRQIVNPDKEALLVTPDDAKAFATAVQRLNSDPSLVAHLGNSSLTLAPNYTWQTRADKLLKALV